MAAEHDCSRSDPSPRPSVVHIQGLEFTDENTQKLGDFLLQEIRSQASVRYPTLSVLVDKLQASWQSCQVPPFHRVLGLSCQTQAATIMLFVCCLDLY